MDSKRRVWIANFSGHDYSKAEQFGELNYVTKGYVSFGSLDRLKWMVAEALKEANAEDYLLLSGAISLGVISALILWHRFNRVNLLVFDKKTEEYVELTFSQDSIDKLLEVVHDGKNYKEKGGVE